MGWLSFWPPMEPKKGALKENTPPSDANRWYPGPDAAAADGDETPKTVPPSWVRFGLELASRVTLSLPPLTVGPGLPVTCCHDELAGLNQNSVASAGTPSAVATT